MIQTQNDGHSNFRSNVRFGGQFVGDLELFVSRITAEKEVKLHMFPYHMQGCGDEGDSNDT
jgi:hypothetical protein